jgi:hypothetical protein
MEGGHLDSPPLKAHRILPRGKKAKFGCRHWPGRGRKAGMRRRIWLTLIAEVLKICHWRCLSEASPSLSAITSTGSALGRS